MGQHWIPVNLDKREYLNPHALGARLKLWEQLAQHPGTGAALLILLANEREPRGGGDFEFDDQSAQVIGRWAGDRIALFGDYAEIGDLPNRKESDPQEHLIYGLCGEEAEDGFVDISPLVAKVIEIELGGKYTTDGGGWPHFVFRQPGSD